MTRNYRVAVIGRTGKGNYGHGLDVVWKALDNVEVVAVADEDERGRAALEMILAVYEPHRLRGRRICPGQPQAPADTAVTSRADDGRVARPPHTCSSRRAGDRWSAQRSCPRSRRHARTA